MEAEFAKNCFEHFELRSVASVNFESSW